MSVLIRGMKMPTSCHACNFSGYGGRSFELNVCMFTGERQPTLSPERMSNCPLVPVPPHGDLIDRDALKTKQQEDADLFIGATVLSDKSRRDEALNAVANILNAPTVIEAEEGES